MPFPGRAVGAGEPGGQAGRLPGDQGAWTASRRMSEAARHPPRLHPLPRIWRAGAFWWAVVRNSGRGLCRRMGGHARARVASRLSRVCCVGARRRLRHVALAEPSERHCPIKGDPGKREIAGV